MTEDDARWCVLLPCSESELWAVPQNCLAEIVTLQAATDRPPPVLSWRGETVPVLDLGGDSAAPWREARHGTGLVAVFLGLRGEGCRYWGVAIRGQGLSIENLAGQSLREEPAAHLSEHANAAFQLRGVTYQVPDLVSLQRTVAAANHAA